MRKRKVIELRNKIDCVGWSCTSNGHQQGTVVKRDCENTPESKSTAYLTLIYTAYPGDLGGSVKTVESIDQCNGEYKRRPLRSRIRS